MTSNGITTLYRLEADRYYVSCGGGGYLVELGAYDGNGWCGCAQFQCVHQPHLERGDPTVRRCKHLTSMFKHIEHAQIAVHGACTPTKGGDK
jgi:hypothetical protein